MGKTKIEWTEASWNPVRGCSLVSEGCRNCYAMRLARRSDRPGGAYEGLTRTGSNGPTWSGVVRFVPEMLDYPLRLRKPHRIFVNSMSDLFHEKVTFAEIAAIFGVMALAPRHTFQVLTKRPQRMVEFFQWLRTGDLTEHKELRCIGLGVAQQLREKTPKGITTLMLGEIPWPLPNVWMGVSAEDQKAADERIPYLLETPAAVRWVSLEPLLGPIDFRRVPGFNRVGLDLSNWWVVAGGESGPGARPSHPDWFRSIRAQCANAHVPFFFKQWGAWVPDALLLKKNESIKPNLWGLLMPDGRWYPGGKDVGLHDLINPESDKHRVYRVGKRAAGHVLDGREHREYPAVKNSLATSDQLSA